MIIVNLDINVVDMQHAQFNKLKLPTCKPAHYIPTCLPGLLFSLWVGMVHDPVERKKYKQIRLFASVTRTRDAQPQPFAFMFP